jgi:MerR family transcriptional regulator, light-induced transcriptional regulator
MRTVSQKTGFSPGLLRAWERRHKLLEPVRGQGGHRLYTDADLTILNRVRSLMDEGRSIGEIAALGRGYLLGASVMVKIKEEKEFDASESTLEKKSSIFNQACNLIVQAAIRIDHKAIEKVLEQSFASCSARDVIYQIIAPASRRIGELWSKGECSVAGEHLANSSFVLHLKRLLNATQVWNQNSTQFICCCFPDEQHELGSLLLAYEIAQSGASVTYLGQSIPFEDLEISYHKLGAPAICLSVVRSPTFLNQKPKFLEFLDRNQGMVLALGGHGVHHDDPELLARGVTLWNHVESLEAFGARILSRIKQG